MSDLIFKVDPKQFTDMFSGMRQEIEEDLKSSIQGLGAMTYAMAQEEAQKKIKKQSILSIYLENLGWEMSSPGTAVVYVNQPALWIEEGIKPNTDMKPALLKGAKYRIIPFDYKEGGVTKTQFVNNMVGIIDKGLKDLNKDRRVNNLPGVSRTKIEKDQSGKPTIGKLHQFNFGGPVPGKGNTRALENLTIYQKMNNKGKIEREVKTFRTVSSGPASAGKWIHPGKEPEKILDIVFDSAVEHWNSSILPKLIQSWSNK